MMQSDALAHVHVMDDDPVTVAPYVRHLRDNGYAVTESTTEDSAKAAISRGIDLAILDVDLMKWEEILSIKLAQERAGQPVFVREERAGLRVAKWARLNFPDTGLIMTSNQKVEVNDMILGLDSGADDYFVKGDSAEEIVLARVRSVLGRRRFEHGRTTKFGKFELDRRRRDLSFEETSLVLTNAEYRLMEALCDEQNTTKTRAELYTAAFSRTWEDLDGQDTRAVDTLVKNIRRKAAEVATEVIPIATVYGEGYRLQTGRKVRG